MKKRTPTPASVQVDHSLEHGPSLYSHFEDYSPVVGVDLRPLHQRIMAIVGFSGAGKSTFLQSIPNCIVIDCDQKGLSNPRPKALLLPDPSKPVSIPHPRDPSKTITEFNFDFCRAIVAKAVSIKKANPDQPLMVCFDTVPALVEQRIRKLEIDRGDPEKGVIVNFADMNAMEVWPIIARSVCDMIDDCKNAGIGVILSLHIVQDKETRFVNRQRETITTEKVNITNSLDKAVKIRLNEAWRLVSSSRTETQMKPLLNRAGNPILDAQGKPRLQRAGTVTVKKFSLVMDTDDDSSIKDFCKSQIHTLPHEISWEEGNFDPWTTVVQPTYEKAIEDFKNTASGEINAPSDDNETEG